MSLACDRLGRFTTPSHEHSPAETANESDEQLMLRVKTDDDEAFAEIYARHSTATFRLACSLCRNATEAEDVVQESFLSIWRGRGGYSLRGGASLRAWLMTTVRNRALDSIRRDATRKRPPRANVEVSEVPSPEQESSPDEIVATSDRNSTLKDSLRRLPEAQREVIALAYFGGLTHHAIATHLAIPAGTVKGRMRLGLEKLRRDTRMKP